LAAILAFAASCMTHVNEGNPAAGDGEHLVTLSFTVPGAPTRAMDETAVETIDVLLFDPSTDNIVYRAIGTKPVSNQFTVKLPANTYNIVVLANARAMIPAAYPPATTGASFTNDSREDVLAAITKSIAPVTSHQWPATFDRIPMWGYSDGFVVGTSSPTINLTRMVAKVDITVGGAVVDFWLANVRLYNYSIAGSIAPAALPPTAPAGDRYDGYDITQWSNIPAGIKAYAPHLPTGVKATDDYIAYNADLSDTRDIVEYKDNIYAFEAAAGVTYPAAGWKQNTCLVIGGYYQSTAFLTYYRVEFANTTNGQLPLLRNHKYNVTITGVSAHGYPTPEDAYNNPPSNITVQITAWNDGGLDDITFDPQNYLAVDKSELTFYAAGGNKSMAAITDFPSGWTVDANDLPTWLTITAPVLDGSDIAHGLQDVKTTLTLAASTTSVPRATEFYIVAGNLRKKIIVTQSAEEEFSIFITDLSGNPIDELVFGPDGAIPATKQFRVTWLPADADCDVALAPVSGMPPFTFNTTGTGIDPATASPFTGGSAVITIQPNDLAPGDPDCLSRLDFSVANNGQYRMAVLYLRQINKYIIVEGNAGEYAVGNTTPHTFIVKSNIPWYSMFDGEKGDEFTLVKTKTANGGPNPEGEIFEFTLNNVVGAEATFSFKSNENFETYAEARIEGIALPYVTLGETTYSTNATAPSPANISMTTNIPFGELSATVTGSGGLVTSAAIESGPKLKVNFAANPLTDMTFQTYTVQVKHDGQVMATLTVYVSGSGWEPMGGKLVEPTIRFVYVDKFLTDETNCPAGSSTPRSSNDAMWYELWLGSMSIAPGSIIDGTGIRYPNKYGVIWYGTALQEATLVATDEPASYYTLPCVWNQTILSEDVGHIDLNTTPVGGSAGELIRYPYGQYVRSNSTYFTVYYICVVWEP
jgi:hypothetical protein